jgi:hypothetical protein
MPSICHWRPIEENYYGLVATVFGVTLNTYSLKFMKEATQTASHTVTSADSGLFIVLTKLSFSET